MFFFIKEESFPLANVIVEHVDLLCEKLSGHETKPGTGVLLVVPYHYQFHDLRRIIRKKFINFCVEEQVKHIFTQTPFVSFPSGFSFRIHLV